MSRKNAGRATTAMGIVLVIGMALLAFPTTSLSQESGAQGDQTSATAKPSVRAASLSDDSRGRGRVEFGDFGAYWIAGRLFLDRQNNLSAENVAAREQAEGLLDTSVIWYPPWAYPIFVPFALLPFRVGAIAWVVCQLALLSLSSLLVGRWLAWRSTVAIVIGVTFPPATMCLGISQLSIMVLAGAVLFWEAERRGRPFLAGLALVLCSVKPHLVSLLWLVIVLTGPWKSRLWRLAGLGLGIAVLLTATLAWYPDLLANYLQAIVDPPQVALTNYYAATLGMWLRMHSPWPDWRLIQMLPWLVTVLVLVGWGLWNQRRWREVTTYGQWEWALLLSILVVPYGWHYDQTLLLPAFFRLVDVVWRHWSRRGTSETTPMDGRTMAGWFWSIVLFLLLTAFWVGFIGMLAVRVEERWYFFWPSWVALMVLLADYTPLAARRLPPASARL